jgi:ketosteroid isomerase-like protein
MAELTDEEQILQLHRTWYFANFGPDIPLMRTVFAAGRESYLMFNLNGHPYFGVDELADLWAFYSRTGDWELCEDVVMRVNVSGDMAYVVSEGTFPVVLVRDEAGEPLEEKVPVVFAYRSTEIYQRDDGSGGAEWKMWHFHCSPRPPDDEAPTSKSREDATDRRGLGNTPYSTGTRTDFADLVAAKG